jgi:hypothetical protein
MSGLDRRTFIGMSATGLVAAASYPGLRDARPAGSTGAGVAVEQLEKLDPLSLSSFLPLIGHSFTTTAPTISSLSLALADDQTRSTAQKGEPLVGEAFSLEFLSDDGPLPQGIYHLHHQALGAFELFLVPVGPRGEMHATINNCLPA